MLREARPARSSGEGRPERLPFADVGAEETAGYQYPHPRARAHLEEYGEPLHEPLCAAMGFDETMSLLSRVKVDTNLLREAGLLGLEEVDTEHDSRPRPEARLAAWRGAVIEDVPR